MAKAFISHASQDREVAERICSFLEERGIHCWIAPRDVRPGRKYGEEIVDGIQSADAVVLVLTENANSSTFVEREIERAVSYGKPTLPVRVREVQPSRSLELFISNAHWIDAWKPPMEQYLDRLADSIRSLSPETGAAAERKPKKIKIGWRGKRLAKRVGLTAAVLFLIAVGATATWWLLGRERSTPSNQAPVYPMPAPSADNLTVSSPTVAATSPVVTPHTPLPEKATPTPAVPSPPPLKTEATAAASVAVPARTSEAEKASPALVEQGVTPVAASSSVAEFLAVVGNATGRARDEAIEKNARNLPKQITADNLLAITNGAQDRNRVTKLIADRLANPIKVEEALRILGDTNSRQRTDLIETLSSHLPVALTVKELLALIEGAYDRTSLIRTFLKRLPNPLSLEDGMNILDNTASRERFGLIEMLSPRMPQKLAVKDLLALIENTYDRSGAIRLLLNRLPNPLTVEETLDILDSTASRERFGLIEMLNPRMPHSLAVKDLLAIIENTYDRNGAINLMVARLPNPIQFEDLQNILGSTSSRERYGLIEILRSRVPPGLSESQISTLVDGSYDPPSAEKLLKR
jgi:hypothetical protein